MFYSKFRVLAIVIDICFYKIGVENSFFWRVVRMKKKPVVVCFKAEEAEKLKEIVDSVVFFLHKRKFDENEQAFVDQILLAASKAANRNMVFETSGVTRCMAEHPDRVARKVSDQIKIKKR